MSTAGVLMHHTGCTKYKLMPANGIFALGVGHVRRKTIEPGDKIPGKAQMLKVQAEPLTDLDWQVLIALKREFTVDEIAENPWKKRAEEAGVELPSSLRPRAIYRRER
jgi:hypothetical protein